MIPFPLHDLMIYLIIFVAGAVVSGVIMYVRYYDSRLVNLGLAGLTVSTVIAFTGLMLPDMMWEDEVAVELANTSCDDLENLYRSYMDGNSRHESHAENIKEKFINECLKTERDWWW